MVGGVQVAESLGRYSAHQAQNSTPPPRQWERRAHYVRPLRS